MVQRKMKMTNSSNHSRPGIFCQSLLSASVLIALGGCTVLTPKPVHTDLTPGKAITGTAAISHTMVLEPEKKPYICQQPGPDATYDASGSEGFTFINIGDKGGESASEVNAEQEMEGRTPGLMLARELFYRLCEFAYNQKLDQQQAVDLYRQNLSVIEKISEIQAGRTDIKIGQTILNSEVSSAPGKATAAPIVFPNNPSVSSSLIRTPTSVPLSTVTSTPTVTPTIPSVTSSPTSSTTSSSSSSSSSTYKSPWAN